VRGDTAGAVVWFGFFVMRIMMIIASERRISLTTRLPSSLPHCGQDETSNSAHIAGLDHFHSFGHRPPSFISRLTIPRSAATQPCGGNFRNHLLRHAGRRDHSELVKVFTSISFTSKRK